MHSGREPLRSMEDIAAVERIPLRDRLTATSTYELIGLAAAKQPESPALIWLPQGTAADEPVVYSYKQFFARVTQTANLLHDLGIRPGRAVSCLLPNLPETHFALWGGAAAGQINPVNPLLSAAHIAEIMTAAGSKVLMTTAPDVSSDLWNKAQAVRQLLPDLETIIVVGDAPVDAASVRYTEKIDRYPTDRLISGRRIEPDEVAVYFHTGGTTGAPKLAQQTHRNQVSMAWIASYVMDCGPQDRFLVGLPLFHANAAIASGINVLGCGGAMVLAGQNGFRSKQTMADFWRIVARHRISIFSAVPTILATLLDTPRTGCDISSLRTCFCGAAPLPVSLFRDFEGATGVKVLEAYGMTETTLCSTINPRDGERRIGSVGLRVPYHEVKTVVLDEAGAYVRDCEDDEVGIIVMRGDTVTPGYKQSEFNRKLWPRPLWLNSGDLGRRDRDGYFWLAGRAKDLIIRSGHNIDPAIIEETLRRHPAVELAAAVGKPDPYAGEIPVAFVSLRPGAIADPEELRAFAQANVPERPAAPQYVRILDQLPTTAVGKIFKPTLRERATKDEIEAALSTWLDTSGARASVVTRSDKTRGIVAKITVSPPPGETFQATRQHLEKLLMRYSIAMDVVATEH